MFENETHYTSYDKTLDHLVRYTKYAVVKFNSKNTFYLIIYWTKMCSVSDRRIRDQVG